MGIFDWLFGAKHQDLINENGLNEIFFKTEKRKILKERLHTKDGLKNSKYESFYLDGRTVNITANYKDGKLHGECKQWSILGPFGGDCYRYIENYENGELRNRKVYFTGASKPILDHEKKIKALANEENFEIGSSEQGFIDEDINRLKKR
jgi:antitoxin component YwqK of YwqJK toxin-antitoxin module